MRPQASPMSDAIFRPRPYEDIYAEQAYLTTSLRVQSSKAVDLIRRYSSVEEELLGGGQPKRRLRKQLSLVRLQLNEAAEQERAILLRLSELYMEVHSRDTWGWTHRQRTRAQAASGGESSPSNSPSSPVLSSSSKSWSSTSSTSSAALNGASPEFIPMSQRAAEAQGASRIPRASSLPSAPEGASKGAGSALETVDETDEDSAGDQGPS